MKKFLPFLIALFAGIAQGYSLAPANEWLQLAALAVLFFIFAGLRTAKAGFLAGLFFGIGWFVTSLAWLYVSVHDYGYQPPVFAAFVVFIFSCYLALYPAAVGALCAWSMKRGSSAGLMLLAIAPAAWGLTEWLRGVLFFRLSLERGVLRPCRRLPLCICSDLRRRRYKFLGCLYFRMCGAPPAGA